MPNATHVTGLAMRSRWPKASGRLACRAPQDPDRGLEPIGRGARAGADAVRGQSKSPQSPLRPAISGKNRSPIALGDCLIEPIFAMNCAVAKTFSGLSV